ncbi:MAG: NifB/NifX family molybdenum-iron cluster-binding protein [Desulfovibrionaceae bacterium]
MIVCLATYEDRLAALFDTAAAFDLFEMAPGAGITPTQRLSLPQADTAAKIAALHAQGVEQLICGAISGGEQHAFAQAGIALTPWRCGTIAQILDALATDNLDMVAMPGCGRGLAQGGTCHRRRRCTCAKGDFEK